MQRLTSKKPKIGRKNKESFFLASGDQDEKVKLIITKFFNHFKRPVKQSSEPTLQRNNRAGRKNHAKRRLIPNFIIPILKKTLSNKVEISLHFR